MTVKVGQNLLWLVKSGENLLGPYTERQIHDLLRDRVIVPLDEVAKPCGRWTYIRNETNFKKILDELQSKNSRFLNDDSTTKSGEDTSTQTETNTDAEPDDLTEEISQVPKVVQDVVFHSVEDRPVKKLNINSEVFTAQTDLAVKKQAHQTARWLWALTSIFIVVAVTFVVFQKFIAKPMQSRTQVEEGSNAGIEALELGDYKQALAHFSKAHAIDPSDSSLFLYLGMLKIQVEDQPFLGRQLIEKLKNKADKDLKRVMTGIGLAYLKEGDAKSAEIHFNKALDIDPLFDQAVVNLGAAAMYSEDWAKASNHLLLAVKSGLLDGAEVLMLTQAYINLFEKSGTKKYLTDALKYLQEFSSRATAYRLEIALARSYIEYLSIDKRSAYFRIDNILEMDFDETENHRLNLFVHRELVKWSLISSWCMKMTADLDPSAHVIAFESLCLFKAGDAAEANQKIEDALLQAPKDPVVLSVHAYIQRGMGSTDNAMVSIEKALKSDTGGKSLQAKRMAGVLCREKNNIDCERKVWSEVLAQDVKSLVALAGLSRIYLSENNIVEAKRYLARGLKVSNSYKPFIQLSKSISLLEDKNKVRGL